MASTQSETEEDNGRLAPFARSADDAAVGSGPIARADAAPPENVPNSSGQASAADVVVADDGEPVVLNSNAVFATSGEGGEDDVDVSAPEDRAVPRGPGPIYEEIMAAVDHANATEEAAREEFIEMLVPPDSVDEELLLRAIENQDRGSATAAEDDSEEATEKPPPAPRRPAPPSGTIGPDSFPNDGESPPATDGSAVLDTATNVNDGAAMNAKNDPDQSNRSNDQEEEEEPSDANESIPLKAAAMNQDRPSATATIRDHPIPPAAAAAQATTGRGLEVIQDDNLPAPVPAAQTAALYEATDGGGGDAKIPAKSMHLLDEADEEAPMPPAQTAALYETADGAGGDAKIPSTSRHLLDEADGEAPMPPAQMAALHQGTDDEELNERKVAAKKLELVDDEGAEGPAPAAAAASRHEETAAVSKGAIMTNSDVATVLPPAPGELERIAASAIVEDDEALKKPPPVPAATSPGIVDSVSTPAADNQDSCPVPSISVDEESPPPVTNDPVGVGATANTNDGPGNNANINANRPNRDNVHPEGEDPSDADESVPLHIPNAYLVPDEEVGRPPEDAPPIIIDAYAEPLLPWWKQRRTRALIAFVASVVLVAIVAVAGVTMSSNNAPSDDVNATVITNTEVQVVQASASPSVSHAPTESWSPSTSPTSCEDIVLNTAQLLELPEFEGGNLNTVTRVDGRNAAVATRVANSIHLAFFALADDGGGDDDESPRWTRTDHFVEEYGDWDADEDLYDFHLSLSGQTAFLGLPSKDYESKRSRQFELPWQTAPSTASGVVYVYERQRSGGGGDVAEGEWVKFPKPLLPDEPGTYFGTRADIREKDGLASVASYFDKTIHLFQKSVSFDENAPEHGWTQLAMLRLGYNPGSCFILAHESILAVDITNGVIYLYKYDRGLGAFLYLQDPLYIKPQKIDSLDWLVEQVLALGVDLSADDFTAGLNQVWDDGAGILLTNIAAADNYFVFTTSDSSLGQSGWDEQGVSVYTRQDAIEGQQQTFSLLQYFNSSDYDVGFGWELDIDGDLLVIAGKNQTFVFSQQPNGYFQNSLILDEPYDWLELSDRHLFITSSDNNKFITSSENDRKEVVTTLDLEMCTQPMPTQMPSFSAAPTPLHTVFPSPAPSFSSGPSASRMPSHVPSFTAVPTLCYDVVITIVTGENTGEEGGVITWEFYESGDMLSLAAGGPLEKNQTYEFSIPCLPSSDYVFNITESEGDGFGECDSCGYFITVDREYVGGNSYFWYNEVLTFPVPFVTINEARSPCYGDFYFALNTDGNIPERTTWLLADDEGATVLSGGPYHEPKVTYTVWSCLSDGNYTFTILDSEGDEEADGNFVFAADFETLFTSDLNFGTSNTTSFISGPGRT